MSLFPSELSEVARELDESLTGAFVQKVWSPLPRLLYLELRKPGRSTLLVVSAEEGASRISVAETRLPSPEEATHFQRICRHELIGLKLEGVEHLRGDRLVTLAFASESREHKRVLHLEATGPHGNILLTTDDGRILAVSASSTSARRELRAGAVYQAPASEIPEALKLTPSRLRPPDDALPFPFGRAAEALLGQRERARHAEQVRRLLVQPLRTKVQRLRRTVEKVRAEADSLGEAEEHRRMGELLSQNFHLLKRAAEEVTLTRYSESGEEKVTVKLDPSRPPKEQVERHFHLYRRLTRKAERAGERRKVLEEELREAEAALREVEARDVSSLSGDRELLVKSLRPEPPPERRPFREYLSEKGDRIWVGKNAEGNEALTFRQAKGHHLWLHARGVPGSHVVVAVERGQTAPEQAVLDAAHLALHHSDFKGEAAADVQIAPVRQVKKKKGGGLGEVMVLNEKVLHLRVEPERLARLLRQIQPG